MTSGVNRYIFGCAIDATTPLFFYVFVINSVNNQYPDESVTPNSFQYYDVTNGVDSFDCNSV